MDIFCLICGTENPAESRYCANCAAVLPDENIRVVSPLELPAYQLRPKFDGNAVNIHEDLLGLDTRSAGFLFSDEEADSNLWPAETVFVADLDDDVENAAPNNSMLLAAVFEDDQADDVFEQSLSGLRIEDLAEPVAARKIHLPPEPVAFTETDDTDKPIRKPDQALTAKSKIILAGPEQSVVASASGWASDVAAAVSSGHDLSEPIAVSGKPPVRHWGRTLISAAGMILPAIILFGAGVGTGKWLGGIPANDAPETAIVSVVKDEIIVPSLPQGMAYVPGGEFQMGNDAGDMLSRPAHMVRVEPFYMDMTEVSNEAYLKFVTATGHDPPSVWEKGVFTEEKSKFPVTGVTWYEAAEYAAWMGKRLPTEAEWELAARGFDGRIYPWGNVWDTNLANVDKISEGIRSVGSGEKSPFGLFDMAGNVWEWTASDARAYSGGKEFPWSRLRLKIIRGGNWQSGSTAASAVFRGYYGAEGERDYSGTGFRCVKDEAK